MRRTVAVAISGICIGLAVGCASEPLEEGEASSGGVIEQPKKASCATFVEKLTECGLLLGGQLRGCEDDDPVLPCSLTCLARASCTQMEAWYCSDTINLFAGCLGECQIAAPQPEFDCTDGLKVPAIWQCDGEADCPGGQDELGCGAEAFVDCGDGSSVPVSWRCDGGSDCPGGQDELDCAFLQCE